MADGAQRPAAEQQAQLEEWGERRAIDWHAPGTVTYALTVDHAQALAMNADGDAGRAAFLGEVTAERFGQPAGDRVRMIAAIHALADFFRDHPAVPLPYSVVAYATTTDPAELEQLAAWFEVEPYGDDREQLNLMPVESPTGILVTRVKRKDAGL